MSESMRLSATQRIAARPREIFAIISDPQGHVQIDGSGMLIAPKDAKPITAVGDVFVMDMDGPTRGYPELGVYTVENTVTRFVDDAALEWTIGAPGTPPIGHVWGYELTPVGDTETDVTHYYDWSAVSEEWRERIGYPVISADGLGQTLDKLSAVVSADGA